MNAFIEVNNYCELKCRFCVADLGYKYPSTNISLDLIDEIIKKYKDDKMKAAFITGGEPLLHPAINDIVCKFAANNYYTYITTNGQRFSNEKFAVDFMYSGIHRISIPVYGCCSSIYDAMTGVEGSFNALKLGLDNIFYIKRKYASHIKIELRLLMAKYNISNNKNVVEWIRENYPDVDYLSILGLQLSSRTNNYEHMIEISMTEAAPYLRSCLKKIREYGIKCIITGIPLCVLGEEFSDYYDKKINSITEQVQLFPHLSIKPHLKTLADCLYREESSKKKSSDVCQQCRYQIACEGVQERYIQKYGFDDLKAIT
ncbi:MAG: radical SAM protein [Oscillospiraceae bacterium]|jgi:MoaA/NifB/PqqE/SkfB family radical SAM enzyme|nr:radical SAM protein [Oscillospiraceae bacterium]